MIGIIGPADSTQLACAVAREEGLGDEVLARSYEAVEEAPALARELDPVCQVLLFTGRVPYVLGRASAQLRAALLFVPHSGADLYRTLVHLVRESGGRLPRVSLDTIEPAIVHEAWRDLGLEPPRDILPLEVDEADGRLRPTADIVAFHRERFAAGAVDVCLTCVGSVYRELRAAGIPAWRISHTRSVLREALRQAHLAARLAITESTQPAVVLVWVPGLRITSAEPSGAGTYQAQRRRLRARETMLDLAERLQGRLAELDDESFIIHTNRGTVDAAVSRLAEGSGPLERQHLPPDARVGIGLGASVAGAEENARRALVMGERHGDLHVAFPDGEVLRVGPDGAPATYRLRETHEPTLRVAEQLGMGPLALARLTRALRQVDASSVTAAELARAYGIEARSARRLMTALLRAGIATRLGRQGGPRAGRPQTVYRIDVARLVPPRSDGR